MFIRGLQDNGGLPYILRFPCTTATHISRIVARLEQKFRGLGSNCEKSAVKKLAIAVPVKPFSKFIRLGAFDLSEP